MELYIELKSFIKISISVRESHLTNFNVTILGYSIFYPHRGVDQLLKEKGSWVLIIFFRVPTKTTLNKISMQDHPKEEKLEFSHNFPVLSIIKSRMDFFPILFSGI